MKRFKMPESMQVASIWVMWGFLAIGVLGSALFVVLDHFKVTRDAAAWVQATGSLLAVWAAIYAVRDQRNSEQRARDERAAIVIANLRVALERAVQVMGHIRFELQIRPNVVGAGPTVATTESAESALASLKRFDLLELPRAEFIEPVVEITRCFENVILIYKGKHPDFDVITSRYYNRAQSAFEKIKWHQS